MKGILPFLLITHFAFSSGDFEHLMGDQALREQHVKTQEDFARFAFFKKIFETNQHLLWDKGHSESRIPKVFHFVWLGPEDFPKISVERVKQWMKMHPSWTFKYWTDIDRNPPVLGMKKMVVNASTFKILESRYYDSINFGEKAKILTYEILFDEGGVYIDHDVVPLKSFDALNQRFDFYCGLEQLGRTILSSSVVPSTHLIAAKSHHPVIEEAMVWLDRQWSLLAKSFPGTSRIDLKNRALHRCFWALSEGIEKGVGRKGNRDIIFPTSYFNGSTKKKTAYALHYHDHKWTRPTRFESRVEERFESIIHDEEQAIMITLFLAGISLLGFASLLLFAHLKGKRAL